MLTKQKKQKIIKESQVHDADTGSSEVQVSLLTKRINELATHLKKHQKDNHSRRGLLHMVASRRAHLSYLQKNDLPRYEKIVKKLNLDKKTKSA